MNKPMKLSIHLERQLTKLFALVTSIVVLCAVSGIYIANLRLRDSASNFIASHVTSLVESGVSTQSVSEIDREVRRLYKAWSQAQSTDLRISVHIDGVLVGKAGQLQPLGWLSSGRVETKELPSGQTMVVRTETDFSKSAAREAALIALLIVAFAGGFFLVRHLIARNIQSLTTPLEERMAWLKEVATHLPDSVRGEILPAGASVEEIAQLDEALNSFVLEILRLEARVKEAGIKEGRVDLAERVAHALKGKLGVLRLRIENMPGLGREEKRALRESVNGLMMSSREMLEAGRPLDSFGPPKSEASKSDSYSLSRIVENAVRQRNEISILIGKPQRLSLSMEMESEDLIRIPSRFATGLEDSIIALIDNALEASEEKLSAVEVVCRVSSGSADVRVTDSGKGIPPEVLPQLLKERATFGKRDGNGLGLFHASELMKKLGGRVEIESKLGRGTSVSLIFGNVFEYERAN